MTSPIIMDDATAASHSPEAAATSKAGAPQLFKALMESVTDLSEMQKSTFGILQKQMLEAQGEVLRSLLSTVERRLKTVKSEAKHEESSRLVKVGIK